MTTYHLLAPGPSMTPELAIDLYESGVPLGVIGNCFELVPSADFLAASDEKWWAAYPKARRFDAHRYTAHPYAIDGVMSVPDVPSNWNSGVLALEVAVRRGATEIILHGFDMQGTHYFGPYVNGLGNTTEATRRRHLQQYQEWAHLHRNISVINCTPHSALACFPIIASCRATTTCCN